MNQPPTAHTFFRLQELHAEVMGHLIEAMEVAHCCYMGGECTERASIDYPIIFKVVEGITKEAFDKLDEMAVVINQMHEGA
ncbi:MAG: hypothetical protein P1P84_22135 [Deferrisomatales bacterium]|nr:hypothetical protein [Deferrisomatales bacterium]